MQSAEFLSAVFFYLKVGENLNQNWIVENLNNAFSTWNGKLGELWGLVTTGPQTFKGGAVWSVMQTLHNGMVGIGYALVVLFFAISLCKNTMNFHELKRPEAAIHYSLHILLGYCRKPNTSPYVIIIHQFLFNVHHFSNISYFLFDII